MLSAEVRRQIGDQAVEHVVHAGPGHYGTEMRRSAQTTRGRWLAYLDDDDWPEARYVEAILEALQVDDPPDVVTLGSWTPPHVPAWLRFGMPDNSGIDPVDKGNIKSANHYCAWRREIWLSSVWLPRNYGAEYCWYTMLRLAYPHLRETHVHELLHRYNYNPSGTLCQDAEAIGDSLADGGNEIGCWRHRTSGALLAGPNISHLYGSNGKCGAYHLNDLEPLAEIKYT